MKTGTAGLEGEREKKPELGQRARVQRSNTGTHGKSCCAVIRHGILDQRTGAPGSVLGPRLERRALGAVERGLGLTEPGRELGARFGAPGIAHARKSCVDETTGCGPKL